jgi:hypothetical protein
MVIIHSLPNTFRFHSLFNISKKRKCKRCTTNRVAFDKRSIYLLLQPISQLNFCCSNNQLCH